MQSIKRQSGVTAIGWLIILGLIGFFVFLGLKLFPIYQENFNVTSMLRNMRNEPGIPTMPKNQIVGLIMKRLDVNYIRTINRKHIKVRKSGGTVRINIKYTVKEKLFGDLSLIAEFDESVEAIGR